MIEEWRPVPLAGYEKHYDVSNFGRVKRLVNGKGTYAGKILLPHPNRQGYYLAILSTGGKSVGRGIHTLVAGAFIGPRPQGLEVNHIDGDKTNNTLSNLEYVTPSRNMLHAWENGLLTNIGGEKHPTAKLTEAQAREIRYRFGEGSARAISEEYGIAGATVQNIWSGRSWRGVA